MDSFDQLFRDEYHSVLGLAYVLTGDWSTAEQLTMNGFTDALKDWDDVFVLTSPASLVRKNVSNTALSRSPGRDANAPPSSDVWEAVRRLPKPQAQSIALFYLSGLNPKEIALTLGTSEESTNANLDAGRQRLGEELDDPTDIDLLLKDATIELGTEISKMPVPATPTPKRAIPWKWVAGLATTAVAALVLILTSPWATPPSTTLNLAGPDTSTIPSTTSTVLEEPGPVFGGGNIGVILLFFHGASQDLAAVELDRGLISLTPLAGLGQESPPFRMINVGGHLVAGWGDIYATRISTREETHLGEATFALPAAEDDRVWMIHYSGGALGVGSRTVWQVGLDGRSLTEPVELPDDLGFALAGIPGGLALQTNAGLTLWYATSDDRPTLGDGDLARVLDSNENQLVWCTNPCDEVVVTTFPDLDSTLFPVPDGHVVFSGGYGHMAPNGIHIAALLRRSDDPGAVGATALWILDLLSGESVVRGASGEAQFFSWSPGGDHLFATSYSWMEGTRTNFWWYEMRSGDFLSTSREINGMLDVIAIYSIGLDEDLYFDPEFAQPFPRPD